MSQGCAALRRGLLCKSHCGDDGFSMHWNDSSSGQNSPHCRSQFYGLNCCNKKTYWLHREVLPRRVKNFLTSLPHCGIFPLSMPRYGIFRTKTEVPAGAHRRGRKRSLMTEQPAAGESPPCWESRKKIGCRTAASPAARSTPTTESAAGEQS